MTPNMPCSILEVDVGGNYIFVDLLCESVHKHKGYIGAIYLPWGRGGSVFLETQKILCMWRREGEESW